jgi:hypothetical protein
MEQLQNYIYGLILTELRQLQEKNPPPPPPPDKNRKHFFKEHGFFSVK